MRKSLILCVDDEQIVLNSLKLQLINAYQDIYEIETTTDPSEALDILRYAIEDGQDVPVIISDYIMPGMMGDEFLMAANEISKDTLKVMLTGQATLDGVASAINQANLFRYIAKPWAETDLCLTINKAVENFCNHKQIVELSYKNERLYKQMKLYFVSSIKALSNAIDARDKYTIGHSNRVTEYSKIIGTLAGLDEDAIERLEYMSTLHDVGKIGIADNILLKEDSLTDAEFKIMRSHVTIGAEIIKNIVDYEQIVPGLLYHHERIDGAGYPGVYGGKEIPIEARIVCIADSFDAMTSDRPYRKGMSQQAAVIELKKHANVQFDQELTDMFCEYIQDKNIVEMFKIQGVPTI